ncbi:hypothetical protein KGG70_gp04 [Streptomyces phage Celia]|uniref:Uncharacterized protein n=1 Tax=Streptomyces phage Celia TaxID=2590946 RepID=A0A516KRG8_9CAUD|nr:hypothetical protein KGG70_gp04 [Streptomyces phage Celia]QDP44280.1 hypothetical protein SEA_CELIA_77 [Streptomyces phage Celia]QFG10542.1 hypothetical protein SEA_URZA_79 [Streptomyces phage Urza]QJD50645.1 hypothetical protein SEA_ITZA_80 [Streptomyces phage Itza]USH45913.1 hypothetical protein SEA_VIEENROSE_78 [Streptomyces phage VieEnRose]
MQLRKGQTVSLTQLARQSQMTEAQRVESRLRANDLTALAARFAGK